MKRWIGLHTGVITLLPALLLGCQLRALKPPAPRTATESTYSALAGFVADSMGVVPDRVVFRPFEQAFIVEGDGAVSLEDAQLLQELYSAHGEVEPIARRVSYAVSSAYVSKIRVYAPRNLPADWRTALDAAISNWNATGSRITLTRVKNPRSAHLLVSTTYRESESVAMAYYPDYYGRPGKGLTINTYWSGLRSPLKVDFITHALGHALGFTHTEVRSVMNAHPDPSREFTPEDLLALRELYPR